MGAIVHPSFSLANKELHAITMSTGHEIKNSKIYFNEVHDPVIDID